MTREPSEKESVAEYVREMASELAEMTRRAGQDTLTLILEMAVLEAADLRDKSAVEAPESESDAAEG
jgi:hypothetical protein